MVQGGLKSSRSSVNMMAGIAWKPKSGKKGSCNSSGNKRRLSMRLIPQYRMLTRTSNGVEHTEMMFLALKRARLYVRSAKRPSTILASASARPMMVKN